MKVDKIEGLNMHDSVIMELRVARQGDTSDTVDIRLKYIDDYDTMETSYRLLRFSGCYKLHCDINFGVDSPDSILKTERVESSELIQKVKMKFPLIREQLSSALNHYRIETSTSGSTIDLVAKQVELISL